MTITSWLSGLYMTAAAGIALFGVLGLVTLWFYWRHRHESFPCPKVAHESLPPITVQLPIYNERFVVGRLISAAANLDYPLDRLQIQVIDDSTDDTTEIAESLAQGLGARGLEIQFIHRDHREGYKAGALKAALAKATGEFIVVFDADFEPERDFLQRTVPHFLDEPNLGMIQTRWGHLNSAASSLTAAQTIALDKHFAMEQTVRHRANLYPKFNGSAGIWRRDCLVDAGGWEDDTVCEDLCLSTRAILKGWQFRFLNDVVARAELPRTVAAYKNEQSRWAKGSTQCLVKFGPAIVTDHLQSPIARIYALLSMAGYTTHLLVLLLLIVQVPLIYMGYRPPFAMLALGVLGIGQPLLFVLAQRELYPSWWRRLRYFPTLLLVAIGLAPSNSRAIMGAVFGGKHVFVRTPKGQSEQPLPPEHFATSVDGYRLPIDWITVVELMLAAYAIIGLVLCFWQGNYGPVLFMLTCAVGFSYVALASIRDRS
jgi:cellulose synthase/poly-beta-1,6-N-acetylglucosamine synthase-like glycosyltransferase